MSTTYFKGLPIIPVIYIDALRSAGGLLEKVEKSRKNTQCLFSVCFLDLFFHVSTELS